MKFKVGDVLKSSRTNDGWKYIVESVTEDAYVYTCIPPKGFEIQPYQISASYEEIDPVCTLVSKLEKALK